MSAAERQAMNRPTYTQRHPAMRVARNIVDQILDEAGTDIATRQRINDDCDQFVAWMVDEYAGPGDEEFCPNCFAGIESSEHHEKCIQPLERAEDALVDLRERVESLAARWECEPSPSERHAYECPGCNRALQLRNVTLEGDL